MGDTSHWSYLCLGLFLTLFGCTCSMLLVPSCGWICQLICLLSISQHTRLTGSKPLFCFLEGGTTALDGSFSFTCKFWLVSCMFSWPTPAQSHCCPQECPQELAAKQGEMWVWHSGCWGCPWARWEDAWVRFSQLLMGGLSAGVQHAVGGNCVSLMPSDICICHFPNLLPTPSPTSHPILEREMGERWVSSIAPCTAKELEAHSLLFPFLHRRDPWCPVALVRFSYWL